MRSHRPLRSRAALAALAAACVVGLSARGAEAQQADPPKPHAPEQDRFELSARSTTYVRSFQRALLPGPNGAAVSTLSAAPIFEYVNLRATDIDAPWQDDSIDVELSLWGGFNPGEIGGNQRVDGDVTIANVRQRFGPAYVKLGRQVFAGGAARFSQFDGVSAGARAPFGLGVDGYAGFTVLPRWADRPGYHHLGSAADSLLRTPDAYPMPDRGGYWLAGGRAYYSLPSVGEVGFALHEEREASELGRRNASADLRLAPVSFASLSAQGVMDVDSSQLADGRAWLDVYPTKKLSVTAEYLRTNPALFFSRQSVLSVFASDRFDEAGGDVSYRPFRALGFGVAGYVDKFESDRSGSRTMVHARVSPLPSDRVVLQLVYSRVIDVGNGYGSTRASVHYRVVQPVTITAEQYTYVYDQAIRGYTTSTVEAMNVEWEQSKLLRILLGGSVSRTPYASLDAQTLLRVVVNLDASRGGVR